MRLISPVLFAASTIALLGSTHSKFCWTEGMRRLEVTSRGAVEFSDDDRDVKSLSPGGYFRVEENYLLLFGGRRYEVNADGTGRLTRTYFDHDRAKPLDSQGQAWLMGIMPDVIRKSGLGAIPRLQRILRQGGPSAALTEISRIRDDEPKRIYLQELIAKGNLDADQLSSAMLQARKIGSDEEKGDLLITVAPHFLKDSLRQAIFQVAGTIGSDEEHGRVLSELLRRDTGSRETLRLAAKSAGHIGSDEEKAKILVEIAEHYHGDREIGRVLVSSASSIGSDEERRHVLSAVLTGAGTDHDTLIEALRSAAAIGSDEEKAALLMEVAPRYVDGDAARRVFFDAVGSIGSDQERRHVLSALLKRPVLSEVTLTSVARMAKTIGSDEEKAGVLAEMAAGSLQTPGVGAAFFEAVNSIGSDEERKRVLVLVVHRPGATSEILAEVVKSAKQIGSDEEKAAVLGGISATSLQDEKLREAFFAAVDSIGSDEERGRILLALVTKRSVPKEAVIRAIESAGKISSDEVKAGILSQALGAYAGDPQVRGTLRKVLDSIQSDGEYRRVMAAFMKGGH